MTRVLKQSLLGVVIVVASFIAGTMVCEFCVPDTGIKCLNERGEAIVGSIIFAATLAVALLARFDRRSLFVTAALIPGVISFFMLPGLLSSLRAEFLLEALPGGLREIVFVSRHTTLPVAISAALLFLIRGIVDQKQARNAQPCAAPNGGPAGPVVNSGATEGPPSVS
jgi:hypothetical protein